MLPAPVIDATFFGSPDTALRRARCGTSAAAFEDAYLFIRLSAASPALALWMAWEERSLDEAYQRLRELN